MRVISLLAASIASLASFASTIYATPPSGIHAKYDTARHELNVTVQHESSRVKKHFIKTVTVSKNGKEVEARAFDFQTSHRNQTMLPFKINADAGDDFTITADCNEWGTGTKNLTVRAAR